MLATIRNSPMGRAARSIAALCFVFALASCVTKEPAPLIDDPTAKTETALPWNEQQKWEREGEAGAMNQQRR